MKFFSLGQASAMQSLAAVGGGDGGGMSPARHAAGSTVSPCSFCSLVPESKLFLLQVESETYQSYLNFFLFLHFLNV